MSCRWNLLTTVTVVVAAAAAAAALGPQAAATAVVLDFEGVGSRELVGSFYGPGGGGSGPDYGIVFGPGAEGAVDSDALETPVEGFQIANEPSGNTTLVFLGANRENFMTVSGGFTALSFQYTWFMDSTVTLYDGPDTTGTVLGTSRLPAVQRCSFELPACGDPTGVYGVWKNVTVPFSGVARSVGFSTTLYVDDMVITLAPPTNPPTNVPTSAPTSVPTKAPTTKAPTTKRPTRFPTNAATRSPTSACRGRKGMKGNMGNCMMKKNRKAM